MGKSWDFYIKTCFGWKFYIFWNSFHENCQKLDVFTSVHYSVSVSGKQVEIADSNFLQLKCNNIKIFHFLFNLFHFQLFIHGNASIIYTKIALQVAMYKEKNKPLRIYIIQDRMIKQK